MTDSASSQLDAIIATLTAEQSPARRRGAEIVVAFVLDQPIESLVDAHATRELVIDALTEQNLARVMDRHVKPGWGRYAAAVRETPDSVGSLVPESARARIRAAIERSRLPKAVWARGAVEPALIRQLLAPVFADVLVTFAKRIPIPGGAVGAATAATASSAVGREVSGLAGRLGRTVQRRAEKLVDASRSVMGGVGAEMERRIQTTAKEFSEGAVGAWREALKERLTSREGRALLAQISQQVTDHVMMTDLRAIHEDVLKQPVDEILDAVPAIVEHAVQRRFVSGIVEAEVTAFAAAEGTRTLREVLDELGIVDRVVTMAIDRVDGVARHFLGTREFVAWLEELLEATHP